MDEQTNQFQEYLPRRTILRELAGLLLVPVIAGCSQSPPATSSATTPTTSPTSTARKQGLSLYIYNGHTARVTSVGWSSDGKRIVSGSLDKTVRVWDATLSNAFQPYIY